MRKAEYLQDLKSTFKKLFKEYIKFFLYKVFRLGQFVGIDVLPRHFYSEIPNIKELEVTSSWRKPFSMIGLSGIDTNSQFEFVENLITPIIAHELQSRNVYSDAITANGEEGFGQVEADFLFAYVAKVKPKQIFQIGCGVSTAVCLMAADYIGYKPEIICLEPYPNKFLNEKAQQKRIELIKVRAQDYDPNNIEQLGNDLLFFVDSTHTLGPTGEVSRIILEMVPRLKRNAAIHFHDIWFPFDYSRTILTNDLFFWHESILLHAFLAYNKRFCVDVSLSMLHYECPTRLVNSLPNYVPASNIDGLQNAPGNFPSSMYFHAES